MAKRGKNARDENGRWDIGGGAVEMGRTVEETLKCEVKEEYCADVISMEFLGFEDIFREQLGQETHWISFDYKVLVDPKQVKNGEPHKLDEVRWFTLDTLPKTEDLHSCGPKFFERYKDKL